MSETREPSAEAQNAVDKFWGNSVYPRRVALACAFDLFAKQAVAAYEAQRATDGSDLEYAARIMLALHPRLQPSPNEIRTITPLIADARQAAARSPTILEETLGYPWLPCPICRGVEGCDHTVPERARAFIGQAAAREMREVWDAALRWYEECTPPRGGEDLKEAFERHRMAKGNLRRAIERALPANA